MTEQLYYQDSYIKDFEAVVLSCIPNGNHFEAVLDRTAFFQKEEVNVQIPVCCI